MTQKHHTPGVVNSTPFDVVTNTVGKTGVPAPFGLTPFPLIDEA